MPWALESSDQKVTRKIMTCQICGGETRTALTKEKNVSCGDYFEGRRLYVQNLGEIALLECVNCGFSYFEEMHRWGMARYRNEIYNKDYHLCDPPFQEERPKKLAAWLSRSFQLCDLIDFGGGEGKLAKNLVQNGFRARSYDPFFGSTQLPEGDADVVTAFEVVEHVPDQWALFRSLKALCRANGVIVFSTLLKPICLTKDWWYASPRNGHVSFHTAGSLERVMATLGLVSVSLSEEIHACAQQSAALISASSWPSILINDTPKFVFNDGWSEIQSIMAGENRM